jgi:hyaluronan synthase
MKENKIGATTRKSFTSKDTYVFWFLFYFIIYIVLWIKFATIDTPQYNLFFNIYTISITTYILTRFILAYFHRNIPYDESYQPTITFVVPAKNEGDNIYKTLTRFASVNYPREKIEVIAINDGSTDETYEEMAKALNDLHNQDMRVQLVDWRENQGKRHAMAEGTKRANNEIIIFIDSDSFIEPDCVKHLTKYFAYPSVGAVSGHTEVYNKDTNLLTNMQAIRYYISFSIYKAAESIFGSVTCCPGCCSAYRKAYLDEFIDQWLMQRFLGTQCTYGDDRSLTNFILTKYQAIYSPEALAYTVVPDKFPKYLKQQQRWKRSWTRETIIASMFMWKKNPIAAISFYLYIFLAITSPIIFFRALAWYPITTGKFPVYYLAGLLLMLLLHGVYYRINNKGNKWLLGVLSFWFYTVILIWQLPWAMLTMKNTGWGTR